MPIDIEQVKKLLADKLPRSQTSEARNILAQKQRKLQRQLDKLSNARRSLLDLAISRDLDPSEYNKLVQALRSGQYARPSDYVRAKMKWLLDDLIPAASREDALEAVDRCLTQPYAFNWIRRSLRSSDMSTYASKICTTLADYVKDVLLPFDLTDILSGTAPEEVYKYLGGEAWSHAHAATPHRIARALNHGDARVEHAVREMLVGEGRPVLMREVIRGVMESDRADFHELVGQLLLAARLQEGLRQSICECADMGTLPAFLHLLRVIDENNLIRFSSVKRAVGTWLGLIADESGDLERVSSKSLRLIRQCLEDNAFREDCLMSEDCMEIHIALWAIAVRDVQSAVERARQLALGGSHHQRLACGYFVSTLNEQQLYAMICSRVILAFPEELDTQAVYLPWLARNLIYILARQKGRRHAVPLTDYFRDEAEARQMIDHLLHLRDVVRKKQVFSPCIFPWYAVTIDRASITDNLLSIAALLEDEALIDSLLPLLPECSVDGGREGLLTHLCGNPRTPAQRTALFNALGDKGQWIRFAAMKCVDELSLVDTDYPLLEELMKLRYADMRPKVLAMLYRQGDDDLLGSIQRFLADKQEPRRIAGLDLICTVAKDEKRWRLAQQCRPLVEAFSNPTVKEQPLLENVQSLLGMRRQEESGGEALLFTPEDAYRPKPLDVSALASSLEVWRRYFPDSRLPDDLSGKKRPLFKAVFLRKCEAAVQAQEDVASLTQLVMEHGNDPVKGWSGEEILLSEAHSFKKEDEEGGLLLYPVWKSWFEDALGGDPVRLLRACMLINTRHNNGYGEDMQILFGPGFDQEELHKQPTRMSWQVVSLFISLAQLFVPAMDQHHLALGLLCWMADCLPEDKLWRIEENQRIYGGGVRAWPFRLVEPVALILGGLLYDHEPTFPTALDAVLRLDDRAQKQLQKIMKGRERQTADETYSRISRFTSLTRAKPNLPLMLRAAATGVTSRRAVYAWLFSCESPKTAMMQLSLLSTAHRALAPVSRRLYIYLNHRRKEVLTHYLGHETPSGERDEALLRYADETCVPLLDRVIEAEIRRGVAPTEYSDLVDGVTRIYGAEHFTAILEALGKDKLKRYDTTDRGRTENLCHLLRCSVPEAADTADSLRALVKARKIKTNRLIEAALYVPEWIELIAEAIDMPAFVSAAYYFMAHMNEEFDEVRMARIARFTPLTADELQNGAFDIGWFRSAYEALGEETFNLVYDAAKYISTGSKHARARKYADAALGRLDPAAVKDEVREKRNKDWLMAYALIPLEGEKDIQARYLYIQQFLKESRSFGAQRAASEKIAAEMALSNLAMNAGYADAMRLTLRMETLLTTDNAELFTPRDVEGVLLCLAVDEQGVASVVCEKDGKALKSIPAKIKKNEYVLRLTEMKKQLVEQQRRARRMLEEAMESDSAFTAGEIAALMANPVIAPMLAKTVFMQGERFGFTDGLTLTDESGASSPLDAADSLVIAHPFHLWKAKKWLAYQQKLFADRIVQPFRQVFRELYIKTPEEAERNTSLRYAGHQIQPKRTLACLKTRRWIADAEAGLQKVYYQENIVATIWAMADWFSPADIEAPTLEHVAFLDRKTGNMMTIGEVPEVIFSEVMRDVDLAVSVAHAGAVDPESSHSTIEMRAALLALTLPLFRLGNVVIEGSHALIDGKLARYSVHLGSGVVHQRGGTMLSVLPVHSQHRGRLFLPFADDDPKTAEILSKVLLFAEDAKIKDPGILEQIIQ